MICLLWLEREFNKEEILNALNSIDEDKAPGLMGSISHFASRVKK